MYSYRRHLTKGTTQAIKRLANGGICHEQKSYHFLAISLSVFILLGVIFTRKEAREPIIFSGESASLRELSIDDKIREAQIIMIGEVKTTLPSKWKFHNEKDTKDASPQEFFEAEGLFTDSMISIEQILKGNYAEPTIRARSFMGETEKIRWVDSSEPAFRKGKLTSFF